MRQWHLEGSPSSSLDDLFYLIAAIAVLFFISSAVYQKFPKFGPIFGSIIWGYATYGASQQYFRSYTAVIGFGFLTVYSIIQLLYYIQK